MVSTILNYGFPLRVQAMVTVVHLCLLGSEEYESAVAGCLHKSDYLPSILGALIKLSWLMLAGHDKSCIMSLMHHVNVLVTRFITLLLFFAFFLDFFSFFFTFFLTFLTFFLAFFSSLLVSSLELELKSSEKLSELLDIISSGLSIHVRA